MNILGIALLTVSCLGLQDQRAPTQPRVLPHYCGNGGRQDVLWVMGVPARNDAEAGMIGAIDALRFADGAYSRVASVALHVPRRREFSPLYLRVSVSNRPSHEPKLGEHDVTVLAFAEGDSSTRFAVLSLSLEDPRGVTLLENARLPRAKSVAAFVDGRHAGVVGITRRGRDAKDVLMVSDFETTQSIRIGELLASRGEVPHSTELRVMTARADVNIHETVARSVLDVLLVGDGALIALRIVEPFRVGEEGALEKRVTTRRVGTVPPWFHTANIETSRCPSMEGSSLIHAWTGDGDSVVLRMQATEAKGFVVESSKVLTSNGRRVSQPAQWGWGRMHFGSARIGGDWVLAEVNALEGGPSAVVVRAETDAPRVLLESSTFMPPMQGGVRFVMGKLHSTFVLATPDQAGELAVRWASDWQEKDPSWQSRRFEYAVDPARQVIELPW